VKCSDYRTISLICHASKIMLRVLTKKNRSKGEAFARLKSVRIQKKVSNERRHWSGEDNVREKFGP
jgi:uncharacterized protein involved in tellurium resistance